MCHSLAGATHLELRDNRRCNNCYYHNYPQETINKDDVRICRVVNDELTECQTPTINGGDRFIVKGGKVKAEFGGVYV